MNAIKPEFTSQVMSNTTSGILPYQQALIDHRLMGGFKRGEMALCYSAGRQTGKSMLNQMYGSITTPAKFTILDQAPVDGATWYTVSCATEVSIWLREQPKELHHEALAHGHWPQFDIHEKLYTLLALRWS